MSGGHSQDRPNREHRLPDERTGGPAPSDGADNETDPAPTIGDTQPSTGERTPSPSKRKRRARFVL